MSLKKKIILGFLISAVIMAVLVGSALVTFIEMKKEIGYLELADSLRSKTLQLRRHEKNFFLYGDETELEGVHVYVRDIRTILKEAIPKNRTPNLLSLAQMTESYSGKFQRIEMLIVSFRQEFLRFKPSHRGHETFFRLVDSSFLERPKLSAELLEKEFSLPPDASILKTLTDLSAEIGGLRRDGEEIVTLSKDLDGSARRKVDTAIGSLQIEAMVLFPVSFVLGLSALFIIGQSTVKRLKLLTQGVENAGRGVFSSLDLPKGGDEVGALIAAFNKMEEDLTQRDIELEKKNEELLQSRKLASIGTLAAGVAHELNNPLNNIYISGQILGRELKNECSPTVKEIVGDILGQTVRVKGIVADLLEFARGKEPQIGRVNLRGLLMGAYKMVSLSIDTGEIELAIEAPQDLIAAIDAEQIERVFINLISNAVHAMSGKGRLVVKIGRHGPDMAEISVTDSGKGIPPDVVEKIFDPFYTTKDKGTGLGLAIAFNIVKKHGGEIGVQSTEGLGTTFTLLLPLAGGLP